MKGLCGACGHVHDSSWTTAVGRFDPNTATTYRATYTGAVHRDTRAESEADMCAHYKGGQMSEHPIYFERTSDGEKWPACGCGEVQLMSDGRSADAWIEAHHAWKSGEACIVCGKPGGQAVSHWECERQLLDTPEGGVV